ncbi:MAG: guanine permease [Gemmatimonadetes bacterium]|nr:guanine permease [Gemmatimonadota bacterium]
MDAIARFFEFDKSDTDLRTEVVGGATTFVTMAYIIAVNPAILAQATGQELFAELVSATCLSAAIATLLMAFSANYPFALAPGMGLNAFFTFSVVMGMGVRWDLALSVVLAAGLIFLVLSLIRVREVIMHAVPAGLKHATAAGIGLFIAFIGLKNAGVIVSNDATLVAMGNLHTGPAALALVGLVGTAVLMSRRIRGAILIGILGVTGLAIVTGVSEAPSAILGTPVWPEHLFGKALENLEVAFDPALITVVFAFLFVDLFDTMGTLVGLSQRSGFLDQQGKLPRAKRALISDSLGTVVGAVFGSSPVTTYIESASGISEGARTGLASVVVAILFLVALLFTPLIEAIPVFATAPALIVVGVLMASSAIRVPWDEISEAVPAFLTILVMPLTFSIAHGVAAGIVMYPLIKRLSGKGGDVHILIDVLAVVFIARYLFLAP